MNIDEYTSDFERTFLDEMKNEMFVMSIDDVRQKNHAECQEKLQQTRLYSSSSPSSLILTDNERTTSKLFVYERVYLLPEEVRRLKHYFDIVQHEFMFRQCFYNMHSAVYKFKTKTNM
jgi:hypothetical protein